MSDKSYFEVLQLFGIADGSLKELGSYDDANYIVQSGNEKYILKEYVDNEGLFDRLQAESRVMLNLYKLNPNHFQRQYKTPDGNFVCRIETKDGSKLYRLLDYLKGDFIAEVKHTDKLLESFGNFLAKLDIELANIKEPSILGRQNRWDLQFFLMNENLTSYIKEPSRRKIVEYFFLQEPQVVFFQSAVLLNP